MTGPAPAPLARLRAAAGPATWRMGQVALAVFALDRLSKWWVVGGLDLAHSGRLGVWPPYLTFVMAWNRGVNFGIGVGVSRWVLIGLAVVISTALALWVRRRAARDGATKAMPLAWGAGIIIGGALGNAWDRVVYGAVADFLNMSCCGIANPYAFNVADVAIFAGAALIVWKA